MRCFSAWVIVIKQISWTNSSFLDSWLSGGLVVLYSVAWVELSTIFVLTEDIFEGYFPYLNHDLTDRCADCMLH